MSRLRVLIADDRPQVRRELVAILPLVGELEVVGEAADGLEAVRLAAALRPQAILLDLEMPVMDGYQAAQQIRAACPACRIIALSVHDDLPARSRAAASGVDAFVVKGAPLSVLAEAFYKDSDAVRCQEAKTNRFEGNSGRLKQTCPSGPFQQNSRS